MSPAQSGLHSTIQQVKDRHNSSAVVEPPAVVDQSQGLNSRPSLSESIRYLRQPTPAAPYSQRSSLGSLQDSHDSESSPQQRNGSAIKVSDADATPLLSRPFTAPSLSTQHNSLSRSSRPPLFTAISVEDLARSPKDRLKALLGSGPPTNAARPIQSISPTPYRTRRSSPTSTVFSALPLVSNAVSSSGSHAPASAVESIIRRATVPRISSMDSAITYTSSASSSHPHVPMTQYSQPSHDIAISTPPDAATLIANAGSAETAIQKLLKEAQATAVRGEQLWRLVEKQRTMILGLNRDLERAFRDKERYRKKLREQQVAAPPLSSNEDNSDEVKEQRRSVSQSKAASSHVPSPKLPSAVVSTESAGTASSSSSKLEFTTVLAVHTLDSQLAQVPQYMPPRTESLPSLKTDGSSPSPQELHPDKFEHLIQSPGGSTSQQEPTPITPTSQMKQPLMSSPGEKTRKGAPAPLDLSKPHQATASLPQTQPDEDSGSDYEDILYLNKAPQFERGRRRTREDDDCQREEDAMEEERRSRSVQEKKSRSKSRNKSQSKSKPPLEKSPLEKPPLEQVFNKTSTVKPDLPLTAGLNLGFGLPSSPRAPLLGGLQSPLQPYVDSIASTLDSSAAGRVTADQRQVVLLPLKSPGLPMSPRPNDRPQNSPMPRMPNKTLASPGPASTSAGFTGIPLSPRAPRHPLPVPPNTPLASLSSHIARAETYNQQTFQQSYMAKRLQSGYAYSQPEEQISSNALISGQPYRGLISEQYPTLLLPPNALPSIDVRVHSSRLRPSRHSMMASKPAEEDSIFTLAVHARSDGTQLWRVEKTLSALPVLDHSVRLATAFTGRLPDRSLFTGHSPMKIDARRAALNEYFVKMLDTPMDEKAALIICQFFSADVVEQQNDQAVGVSDADSGIGVPATPEQKQRKDGYLAKKGKQFGGWKARYFVLEASELRYYEAPGGQHLGIIKLQNAQIGRQNAKETDEDAEFRHAFVVLEPKRRDSSSLIRHVLCAESDEERDEWVDALMQHVDAYEDSPPSPKESGSERNAVFVNIPSDASRKGAKISEQMTIDADQDLQAVNYEDTIAAVAPTLGDGGRNASIPPPTENVTVATSQPYAAPSIGHPQISGPVGGGPIFARDAASWGNLAPPATASKDKEYKKRSIFGFKTRSPDDVAATALRFGRQLHPGRRSPVFGISLAEAAETCPPIGINVCLPAPVYRCIEYLEAMNATNEEGIFRMSGSNTLIKALRDRFNAEGDVRLLDGEFYDIHAVASLLKLYLRDLPSTVLTKELHLDFLKVLDLENTFQKVALANILVHKLPEANFELLDTLARYLLTIVNNSEVNKMNSRNVGIVFAPTLNISAPLISLFLAEHDTIFSNKDPTASFSAAASPVIDQLTEASQKAVFAASAITNISTNDVRFPHKQIFTDLPTPEYAQAGFEPQVHAMHSHNQHHNQGPRTASNTSFITSRQPSEARTASPPLHPIEPSHSVAPLTASQKSSQQIIADFNAARGAGNINAVLNRFPSRTSSAPTLPPPSRGLFSSSSAAKLSGGQLAARAGSYRGVDAQITPMTNGGSPVGIEAISGVGDVKKARRKSSTMWASGGGASGKSGMDLPALSAYSGNAAGSGAGAMAFAMQREIGGAAGLEVRAKSSMQRLRELAGMTGVREG